MQQKLRSPNQKRPDGTVNLDIWELETCRYWLKKSLSMVLTMTHLEKLVFVKLVLKESSIRTNFLPLEVREQNSHLDFFIVMFVERCTHHY